MARRILKAEKKVPDSLGKYVYCVIPNPKERKSFGNLGFDAEEVYTLDYRDLAPVVSDVTYRDYAVNEQEVEVHRNVVEQVMQEHSVIPVAYGMAFKSTKAPADRHERRLSGHAKGTAGSRRQGGAGHQGLSSQRSRADGPGQERGMQLGFPPIAS